VPFEKLVAQIIQAPHQLNLSEQFDNFIFHGGFTFHNLKRHRPSSLLAFRLRHASIGAIANQLQHFVFLINCTAQLMGDPKFIFG
jgi:hypothetical protein